MTGVMELKEARLIPRLIKIRCSYVIREQKGQQPGSLGFGGILAYMQVRALSISTRDRRE